VTTCGEDCLWLFLFFVGVSADGTKLDNLANVMRTIKSEASDELVQLEGQQLTDTQNVAGLLADLSFQASDITTTRDQLQQSIDDLDNEIIPELKLKQQVATEQLDSLKQLTTNAQAELLTITRDSARNVEALSADFDSISQLAQRVADVLQSADVLASASRQFVEIASRQLYTGPSLNETCSTRDVISSVLNGLLQHLQEARDNEISHASDVKDSYEKYIRSLNTQTVTVTNASTSYYAREQEAISRKGTVSGQVAQLNLKIAAINSRLTRLETYKQSTINSFSMRADALNRSIEISNKIIQLINLLQAKMAVRTVTTE